jgi:catalase
VPVIEKLRAAVTKEKAVLAVVAPKIGGVKTKQGGRLAADHALSGTPSIFFDAVALGLSTEGAKLLAKDAVAKDWLRDAFGYLKVIGHVAEAAPLFEAAGVDRGADAGLVDLSGGKGVAGFIAVAKQHRIWEREKTLRSPG